MSFEEEFDSIIRRKSEELDFPFDENNWDKASALLDAERKVAAPRAAFKRFLVPALIAGAIVVSGIVILLSTSQTAPEKNGPVAHVNVKPTDAVTEINATEKASASTPILNENTALNSSSSNENASSLTNSKGANPTVTAGEKTTAAAETPANPAASPKVSEKNNLQNTSTPGANNGVRSKNPVTKNTQGAGTSPNENNNDVAAIIPVKENVAASSNPASVSGKAVKGKTLPAVKKETGNDSPALTKDADKNASPAGSNQTPQTIIVDPLQTGAPVVSNDQAISQLVNNTQDITVEYLPLLLVNQPAPAEADIAEMPLNHIARYDDYVSNGKHKLHFLTAELGGTYLLGWDTQAGKDGKGLDWFGGFNYGLYLTRKISISAGIQAYNIKNINQAFYSTKKTDYDFGAVTSNTTITSNNLYYAAVPIKLAYALNKTSQLSFGANVGYLIGSKNTVEVYKVEDDIKTHEQPVKNTNIYQNAASTNIMLSVGYRVDVMPRLHLNTEVVYGFTDIFKNTKTIKNNEQAMGIRVSLQYTLFDK